MLKKILMAGAVGLFVLFAGLVILIFVADIRSVKPKDAHKAAETLSADVRSRITATSGFTIIKDGKPAVREISDEMGNQDYMPSTAFLVRRTNVAEILPDTEAEAFALSKQIRTNGYPIEVENASPTASRPGLLCVYAERYLNDNGSYVQQPSREQSTLYVTQERFDAGYVSPCAELLK